MNGSKTPLSTAHRTHRGSRDTHTHGGPVVRPTPVDTPRGTVDDNVTRCGAQFERLPVAAGTVQYRFKDTGGSRDTHETDTRTSQTNLKTNPTHRLTRQTTPEPRDTRVHAPHHTTHTRKRGGGDGDGDGARTWEQRGREPDSIGDGTPPRTGRRGGKRLRHPRAADRAHGSCPAARTGHDYARCAAREAEVRRPHGVAARPIAGPVYSKYRFTDRGSPHTRRVFL